MEIQQFKPAFEDQIVDLIVSIQRGEFEIDIMASDQPDLRQIQDFYQRGSGNFWVALEGERVIGTVSLLDIGDHQAALRKMFVHPSHRGSKVGTARQLLETLLAWSHQQDIHELFLGTTARFLAAHRFYEKNGFIQIEESNLPERFPVMYTDSRFYRRGLR